MQRLDQQIIYFKKFFLNCFPTGFNLKEVQVDKLIVDRMASLDLK